MAGKTPDRSGVQISMFETKVKAPQTVRRTRGTYGESHAVVIPENNSETTVTTISDETKRLTNERERKLAAQAAREKLRTRVNAYKG